LEVVCTLSNGYVADDLITLNQFSFYILRCLMHLSNWWSTKKNQMWCTGWMCKSQPTNRPWWWCG